ncbi:hypothetical protein MalM25_20060 [Planctomycetes bacterium MalM25]|nr:hypothetical protein MalM25_20060 [Planctomycetes bacterium MalM25]
MRTPSLNPPLKKDSKGFAFVYHASIPYGSRESHER